MLTILFEYKLLTILIIISLSLSILCQLAAGVIYQSMINESDNMSSTNNRLLIKCKQKYSHYYLLNGKMGNTDVFVDKFIQKISFVGIRLVRLARLSGQMIMLSVFLAGLAVCFSLAAGNTLFHIIPYYILSILGLYLYFSISGLMDIHDKKKMLKMNITDYLENHLTPRLQAEQAIGCKETSVTDQEGRESVSTPPVYLEELESLLEEFFA